ncbi:MAG: adenylosuccinate lyase [Nitrospirae bacterium]|nr:adenylosuccinate lyase [Nitrospirota bacterium]
MIERYSRPEMAAVWTTENKYSKWLQVEVLACEAWSKLGKVPASSVANIKKKAAFEAARVDEIEMVVKHDVIAFLTNVAEHVGEDSRYIHVGLTSSDVLDTALAIQMCEASDIIIKDITRLLEVLKARALEHKDTVMIGRSHGIHAEPTTFGLKMALWYDEMRRNLKRVQDARESIAYGKISGAVGTFANVDPFVEEYVCKKAGLKPAPVSTQIVQRDRHAQFVNALAMVASSLEKFAVEIRHLQRTEVYEAEEYFSKGQKGSSAMPHKRNPIASENITGLARVIRGNAMASYENIALWHERDISHSSVERVIIPDSTILLDYMLNRFTNLMDKLLVYPKNMMDNLNKMKGLVHSQRVLLALAAKGLSREDAYRFVQRNAMLVWEEGKDFKKLLLADKDVKKVLTKADIDECFSLEYHTKNVDYIFGRVFGK